MNLNIQTKCTKLPGTGYTAEARCKTKTWGLFVRERTALSEARAKLEARAAVVEAIWLALHGFGPMDARSPSKRFAHLVTKKAGITITKSGLRALERRMPDDDAAETRALIKGGATGDDVLRHVARKLIDEGVPTDGIVSVSEKTFKRLAKEVL